MSEDAPSALYFTIAYMNQRCDPVRPVACAWYQHTVRTSSQHPWRIAVVKRASQISLRSFLVVLSPAAFCHALTPSLPTVLMQSSLGFDFNVASTMSLYAYSSNFSSCSVDLCWQTSRSDVATFSGWDCNCRETSALHVYGISAR